MRATQRKCLTAWPRLDLDIVQADVETTGKQEIQEPVVDRHIISPTPFRRSDILTIAVAPTRSRYIIC